MELCGRPVNVGRPKGYIEPPPGYIPSSTLVQPPLMNPQFPNMGQPSSMMPSTIAAQQMALLQAQQMAAAAGRDTTGAALIPFVVASRVCVWRSL